MKFKNNWREMLPHSVEHDADETFFEAACKSCLVWPPQRVQFIASEFHGRAVEASQHWCRARIVQRLIELFPSNDTIELADEVIRHAVFLSKHPFGNYRMQTLLVHGRPEDKERLFAIYVLHYVYVGITAELMHSILRAISNII